MIRFGVNIEHGKSRWAFSSLKLAALVLSLMVHGCHSDEPGNPMPPAEVITGGEFVYGPESEERTARRIEIPPDRVAELRRLFDESHFDPHPAEWAYWGELKLSVRGDRIEAYDIYCTGKGPGAYADHLRRYFRGASDASFAAFLEQVEPLKRQ